MATPYPLGRHVNHDPRSLAYQVEPATVTLVSVKHTSATPVLDQGQVGSCTGNAAAKCLSYAPLWGPAAQAVESVTSEAQDERLALSIYSDAETIDGDGPYPPNDNGSSGLSVAKVLKARGLISGYTHATSLAATLTALQTQPVVVGTRWHQDMFNPTAAGELVPTGSVVGGHEYVIDQVDVEQRRVWMQNSWGTGWGQNGRAWMSFATLTALLAGSGDCTVFAPADQPAPTPTPTPAPPSFLDADLAVALRRALKHKVPAYLRGPAQKWLDAQP